MILDNQRHKRLVIFFFYDKDGVVDDYITYMLEDIRKNCSKLLVVCNGKLNEEGKKKLLNLTDDIYIRENIGYDVWAYKEGINYIGWDKLDEFDEMILMNFTIMGPLYPFNEMFNSMDKRDLDFWGLTLFHGAPFDPFNKIEYGYLPLHLQSHFIAIRKSMFTSNYFKEYWNAMPMITCYEEAVGWHEAIFTKKFEDYGFKWDVYVDTRDLITHSYCPILMSPLELIKNRKCPVIKRRSFFHNYFDFLNFTNGECSIDALEYIEKNLDYDVNLIWDNILRVQNQADIKRCLHLNYLLPSTVTENPNLDYTSKKIALIIHIYFEDLIEYCYNYACSMPSSSDIYITTDTHEKKTKIQEVFKENRWSKIQVIVIENRGRDVSSLLVGAKDIVPQYDYVCFAHDKKVTQLHMSIKGESFSYKCFENILKNQSFVKNVINTFENNPRLGLLTPPPPNFAEYYPTIGRVDWGCNYTNTVNLAKELGINLNFDYDKEPIAPLGTMFWFRPEALKTLFDKDWKYEDFPPEPNQVDGTLLHAIERIYPFVVQHEGYYPAWLMVDTFARIEMNNLYYMLRELNRAAFSIYYPNTHYNLLMTMKAKHEENILNNESEMNQLFKLLLKEKLKTKLPAPIFNVCKKVYKSFK